MDFSNMLQIVMMACGIYMAYWAIQMKTTNEIPSVLVGKGYTKDKAKDPDGFIKATFPFTLLTGILIFAFSVVNAMKLFEEHAILEFLFNTVCVIIIILYAVFLTKAQKKYLFGIDKVDTKNKKKKGEN